MPGALARYHSGLTATDAVLAKALGLSETAQIARIETRLRTFMLAAWEKRAVTAANVGAVVARRGGTASTVESAVERAMRPWQKDATPKVEKAVEDIYFLAREAGHKKATGQTTADLTYDTPNLTEMQKAAPRAGFKIRPDFDLVDQDAVEALQGHQVLWVGEHYDENVSKAIARVARQGIVEGGKDPAAVGKLVKGRLTKELGRVSSPGGFHGSSAQYFEGLAANAATVSRAHGQMSSFMRVGATQYEITNPNDSRTCPICSHMDGKVFTVQQGAEQMAGELAAGKPDDIRKVHPWIGVSRMKVLSPTPGAKGSKGQSDKLAKAGFSMPPFHFRCRCAVDITEGEMFGDPLTPPTPESSAVPAASLFPGGKLPVDDKILLGLVNSIPKSTTRLGGGGVNEAKLMVSKTPDGDEVKSVWKAAEDEEAFLRPGVKAGTYHQREQGMYELDRLMGGETVVPPTISRDLGGRFGRGSMQHFVDGAVTADDLNTFGLPVTDSRLRRMTLLDYVSANDDRHGNNIMFTFTGSATKPKTISVVAIDNGLTFPDKPPVRFLHPHGGSSTKLSLLNITAQQKRWLKNLDLEEVATILNRSGEISKKAIATTLVRIRSLQKNPKVLVEFFETRTKEFRREYPPWGEAARVWMKEASSKRESLLGTAELKKIDKIIENL